MEELKSEIAAAFGNKLRIRVSGICIQKDSILLIKHLSIGKKEFLWAPPGGGMNFGESARDCLKREYLEETGLSISVEKLILVNEFFESPLHAIELFFNVKIEDGDLTRGFDPELSVKHQIISEVKFVTFSEIQNMDPETIHGLFKNFKVASDFLKPLEFLENITIL